MSLELALAANTEAMTSLAASLAAMAANQERILAGQEALMAKVGDKPAAATRTRRSAKDDAASNAAEATTQASESTTPAAEATEGTKGNDEPAGTASGAAAADNASDGPTGAELLAYGTTYLDEFKGKDAEKYQARGKFLMGMLKTEFAGAKISEIPDATDRKRAMFYLKRFAAGLEVDFKVDYDFDGDPTQGAAADGDEDEFAIG